MMMTDINMQRLALVVDDSRAARMTLNKLLTAYQFEVIELNSAEALLEHLTQNPLQPDIIFVDVFMSGLDGFSVTQKIKEHPLMSDIPIVICSASDDDNEKNKAINVGALTALSKPPSAEELAIVIAQLNQSLPTITTDDNTIDRHELMAQIMADIELQLLPKLEQTVREITHNIAKKSAEEVIQKSVMNAASTAVQAILDEADLTTQMSQFLAQKGEAWLVEQEEDLGGQLTAQMELWIPEITNTHLKTHLAEHVLSMIEDKTRHHLQQKEVQNKIDIAINHAHEVSGIDTLIQQVSQLKRLTIGLSIAVFGLLIAISL